MKVIGIAILVLIALFTGSCSLGFLVFYGTQLPLLSGPGLLIAAVCTAWLVRLTPKGRAS